MRCGKMNVLGVDGTPEGWATVIYKEGLTRVRRIARLGDIFEHRPYPDIFAVDIPIGLLDAYEIGGRECDIKARHDLGKRGSSVFVPPVSAVLNARSYEEACALSRASSKHDKALSKQTWGIVPKIKEADDLLSLRPELRSIIREVHPEVCFRELAGKPMEFAKSNLAGRVERRNALARDFDVDAIIEQGRREKLSMVDTLDALVACWSAMRLAADKGRKIVPDEKTIWV
jgi:predicted RNase H-like nuclease